jgi:3-hydroxy-D-aspartate aldolase
MDTTYRGVEGVGGVFECALTLLTTVVSRPAWDRVIVDMGLKTATRDFGLPEVVGMEELKFLYLSEEHGKIRVLSEEVKLRPRDRIEVVPNHVCTTVNLHDRFYGVRDGKVEVIWPIRGRGRSQ